MKRRTHIVLRWLAALPVLGAIAVVNWDRGSPDSTNVKTASTRTVPTARLAVSVADAANIPKLFEGNAGPAIAASTSEPELIGIAGRLPDDVEVLLRLPGGGTRSIGIGDSVGDWRLISATAESAVFTDRQRQIVLTMGPIS
ncbi:MAG: hypothetical protein WA908_05395 [Pontixanthobacter sp.]